jgi:hypothetical protein
LRKTGARICSATRFNRVARFIRLFLSVLIGYLYKRHDLAIQKKNLNI